MHVLHAVTTECPYQMEILFFACSKKLIEQGHKVTFALFVPIDETDTPTSFEEEIEDRGFPVIRYLISQPMDWEVAGKFSLELQSGEYDLIHAHGLDAMFYAGVRPDNMPFIATLNEQGSHLRPREDYRSWLEFEVCKLADHVFTDSFRLYTELESQGLPTDQLSFLPGYLFNDSKLLRPFDNEEKNGDSLRILHMGRLTETEDMRILMKGLQRLIAVRSIEMIVLGDGPARHELSEQIIRDQMWDKVAFPGTFDYTGSFIEWADIVVSPTQEKTVPPSIMQAVYTGRPVITRPFDHLSSWVVDGDNGIVITKNEPDYWTQALRQIDIQHPDYLNRAEKLAMDIRRNYSAASWGRRMPEFYEKRLENDPPCTDGHHCRKM